MKNTGSIIHSVIICLVLSGTALPANAETTGAVSPDGIEVTGFQITVPETVRIGDQAVVTFSFKNAKAVPLTLDANGFFVGCRLGQASRDFGHQFRKQVLQPGVARTFSAQIALDSAGTWSFWPAYHIAGHYGPYRWQVKSIQVATAVAAAATQSTPVSYQTIKAPAAGSPYFVLLEGLKLINAGKFDEWIAAYCSVSEFCYNETSTHQVKLYNLPAIQRIANNLLKENGTALYVSRIDGDPQTGTTVKIFLIGAAGSMPKPFTLIKDNGWKFKTL